MVIASVETVSPHGSSFTASAHHPAPIIVNFQVRQDLQKKSHNANVEAGNRGEIRSAKRPRISDKNESRIMTEQASSYTGRLSRLLGAEEPQSLMSLPDVIK